MLTGCDSPRESQPETPATAQPHLSAASASVAAPAAQPITPVIEYRNSRVTVQAQQMSLLPLLFKLAAQAGFLIEGSLDTHPRVSVSAHGITLEEFLELVLSDQSYALAYDPQMPGPTRRLQRLRLGVTPELALHEVRSKRLLKGEPSADAATIAPLPSAEATLQLASLAVPAESTASETVAVAEDAIIRFQHHRATIAVQQLQRHTLLAVLAQHADFLFDDRATTNPLITLTLTDVVLEEALEQIAADTPYALIYKPATDSGTTPPAQLRLGVATARAYRLPDSGTTFRPESMALQNSGPKKERELTAAELPDLSALTTPEQIALLTRLKSSPDALPLLTKLLNSSVDRQVRIEAMAVLENIDSPETARLLESQLTSSDSEIVLSAIDSLEFAGDSQQIPALQRLQSHTDPSIREASQQAIDFLR